MFIGGFLGGIGGDAYGRRIVILWSLMINAVSAFLSAAAPDLASLILCRTLAGIGPFYDLLIDLSIDLMDL
jgi:MFS family permease